jgi:hypothetical protein
MLFLEVARKLQEDLHTLLHYRGSKNKKMLQIFRKFSSIAGTCLALLAAGNANAGLLGASMSGAFGFQPDSVISGGSTTVADPTVEFTVPGAAGAFVSADFSDAALSLLYFTGSNDALGINAFWEFTILDTGLFFASVSEIGDNYPLGMNFLGITGDGLGLRFEFDNFGHGSDETFGATYSIATATAVPAPATVALLGFGLLGLRLRRKA